MTVAAVVAVVLVSPVAAAADHEGPNGWPNGPEEDVRAAPPDDPAFDRAEEGDPSRCLDPGPFGQQYEWFGFASRCAPLAIYAEGPRAGQPMIAGASVDRAWQVTTGRPDVVIAILDTGIVWDETELDTKVWLNAGELPGATDRNANGVIDLFDFCATTTPAGPFPGRSPFVCPAEDALVPDANPPDPSRGREHVGNGFLDGQDLILAFSDGVDDDGNGYTDDIAGWDFFDDDNDPFDASSHSSARNHGTGRAEEAAAETNNGAGGVGSCPECLLMFLRIWDTFIPDTNNYAAATLYAADMGAVVTEVAQGTFADTPFAIAAHAYAWGHGTLPVVVSSDLNTAHHDYPASDPHVLWINGLVGDTEGSDTPPRTWFRQSNITQYGAHAHVGIGGDTGSQATGKAAGVVALVAAWAREQGLELSPNELKQLITMTAEDVTPGNTIGVGTPDPSQPGWDQYFGYGRIDARAAVDAVTARRIPPEVFIDAPSWFRILDPDAAVQVRGLVRARRSTSVRWEVQVAAGIEPTDDQFVTVASGTGPRVGLLTTLPPGTLAALFPDGTDFGAPPTDPDQFDVTIRVRAWDADDVLGEDRRMVYVRRDPDALPGFPREFPGSVTASPRLWDLDGDGRLEVLVGTAGGRLHAIDTRTGQDLWTWTADPQPNLASHATAPGMVALGVPPPPLLTPGIADLDGDLRWDIVVADAAGRIYRLDAEGRTVWRADIDRSRSRPELRARNNALATGMLGAPTLADLDRDGQLEIIAGALDGHLYSWHADGRPVDGFPVQLSQGLPAPDEDNDPKIIVSPAIGDLDGDGAVEIVVPTNEYLPPSSDLQQELADALGVDPARLAALFGGVLAAALGGVDNAVYAVEADGTVRDGWPVRLPTAIGNILPLIGPSIQPVLADLDGDGAVEVFTSAASGQTVRIAADGTIEQEYAQSAPGPLADLTDPSAFIQMLEYPAVGDLDGDGELEAIKGAVSLGVLLNLVAVGQNLPQDHVVQVWDGAEGTYLPAFPRRIADWQLLIAPAVASVGGDARQALVANGLYLFDAFGADGAQPVGWPKFTGGWTITAPAVGDVDGDGTVEVFLGTREGYLHGWRTDGPAVLNDQWWSFAHDERSTGDYHADTRPPAVPGDVRRDGDILRFTAPGDDWWVGTAASYEVRTADHAIIDAGDFTRARLVAQVPGVEAGRTVTVTLPEGAGAVVAVVAVDDAGNRSALAVVGTPPPPAPAAPLPATGAGLAVLALALGVLAARRR